MGDGNDKAPKPEGEQTSELTPPGPQPVPRTRGITQQLPSTVKGATTPLPKPSGDPKDSNAMPATMKMPLGELPKSPLPSKMAASNRRLFLRPGSRVGALVNQVDLTSEKFLRDAPRMEWDGKIVPSLGGIPLLAKLGAGGMGAVYYGINPRLNTEVAVKVLPFHMVEKDQTLIDRFVREAQIAAQVRSPHIANVMDVDDENGQHYLVMEYVAGFSGGKYLLRVRDTGKMGLAELDAIELCLAAAKGLQVAHQSEVIHRDIKPDNIIVPYNFDLNILEFTKSKILDLGLARVATADGQSGPTGTESAMGTPGYMSPEQALDARSVDKRSDIFSLGVTLYALLTGRSPFHRENPLKSILAAANDPAPRLRSVRSDVSKKIENIVAKCMDKDRARRYQNMDSLIVDLEESVKQASPTRDQIDVLAAIEVSGSPATPKPTPYAPAPTPALQSPSTKIIGGRRFLPGLIVAGVMIGCAAGLAVWQYMGNVKQPTIFNTVDPVNDILKNLGELNKQIQDPSLTSVDLQVLGVNVKQLDIASLNREQLDKVMPQLKNTQELLKSAETSLLEKLAKPIEKLLADAQSLPFEQARTLIETAQNNIDAHPLLASSDRGKQLALQATQNLALKKAEIASVNAEREDERLLQAVKAGLEKGVIEPNDEIKLNALATANPARKRSKDAQDLLQTWQANERLREESLRRLGTIDELLGKSQLQEAGQIIREAQDRNGPTETVMKAWKKLGQARRKLAEAKGKSEREVQFDTIWKEFSYLRKKDLFSADLETKLKEMDAIDSKNVVTHGLRDTLKRDQDRRREFNARLMEASNILDKRGKSADAKKILGEVYGKWGDEDPESTTKLSKRIDEREREEVNEAAFAQIMSEAKSFLASSDSNDLMNAKLKLQEAEKKYPEDEGLKSAWNDFNAKYLKKQKDDTVAAQKAKFNLLVKSVDDLLKRGELDSAQLKIEAAKEYKIESTELDGLSSRLIAARQERAAREAARISVPQSAVRKPEGTAGNSIPAD